MSDFEDSDYDPYAVMQMLEASMISLATEYKKASRPSTKLAILKDIDEELDQWIQLREEEAATA